MMRYNNNNRKCTPLLLILLLLICSVAKSTDITFTPNENDDTGPLPLSQNQRNQLSQLEQTISQSPDPQRTLEQVAQANDMSPQDLLQMLQQNHQDLSQGGSPSSTMLPGKIWKVVSAIGVIVAQAAQKNPRIFGLLVSTVLALFYLSIMIPRNGLILSSGGFLSKGHTTLCEPPTKYVNRLLDHPKFMTSKIFSIREEDNNNLDLDEDFLGILSRKKDSVRSITTRFEGANKKKLALVASAQHILRLENFLPDDDDENIDEEDLREMVSNKLFDQVTSTVLMNHRFTEFTDDTMIRFQQKSDRSAILVIPKSGDYKRFGLQPLRMVRHSMDTNLVSIHYTTLRGGVVDGQLQFSARRQKRSGNVILQVHFVVPKKRARKPKKKLAEDLVSTLLNSITRSIQTEVRQLLIRKGQGIKISKHAKEAASLRRTERHDRGQKLEDMAEDRRRKWQRSNPNSGGYRPSGSMRHLNHK